jgi:uncharacterized membrane protein
LPRKAENRKSSNHPAAENIRAVVELEKQAIHDRTLAHRISDRITDFSGSFAFVWINAIWFVAWVLINLGLVPGIKAFDPFPFGLLTFFVSLEAIFLSTFVLISQNRSSREADKRAHLDLQINLLAEQEMTKILIMMKRLCEQMGIEYDVDDEVEELTKKTDVRKIAKRLESDLPKQQATSERVETEKKDLVKKKRSTTASRK